MSNVDLKQEVRAFWESEACGERYGDEQDRVRYDLEPEILTFAEFDRAAGSAVLEIGVGLGGDFVRWCRAGATATGVDLTARALHLTQARLEHEGLGARLCQADAERLPFPDDHFDLVYSWGVLHHTPDTAAALREAVRVLRPGGVLKVMLYHRHSWFAVAAWGRFAVLRGRPWRGLRDAVSHVESAGTQAFTVEECAAMLRAAGLGTTDVRPVLTHWDRKWTAGAARLTGDRFGWFLLARGQKA